MHRGHHHHGQHPWHHQKLHRVGAQHGDGIDLFGHLHGAQFGRVGRGHLAGEQGGGEQGGNFPGKAKGEQAAHGGASPLLGEFSSHLDVEHRAGGERRDEHNQEAAGAGFLQLQGEVVEVDLTFGHGTHGLAADQQAGSQAP